MKKNKSSNFLLILVLLLGLSLLLYPSFSDYWNALHQSRAIATYTQQVAKLDTENYDHIWAGAVAFNYDLLFREDAFALTEEQAQSYWEHLNLTGDGIMGYIEIPSINCSLPVYHGVDEAVLQVAVGHLEWSSLPTGGESTHCVLSGHRGLPSAKLFTNLDQLREKDLFMLRVLDELLTYEVDQILIVEPNEVDALLVEAGKDLCTLVTCTPYGINSHRLLVRGHRVENTPEAVELRITADAIQIEPLIIAPAIAVVMLLVLVLFLSLRPRRK